MAGNILELNSTNFQSTVESGTPVLVDFWAPWCGPCRTEMPALDRLQAKLGGPKFEVVALSTDVDGVRVVQEFYASLAVKHLAIYVEGKGNALTTLGAPGLPTTLLIDAEGRELGRYLGAADWESDAFIGVLHRQIERSEGRDRR